MMNMARQHGSTVCGLYAIATLVSLAFWEDPTMYTVIFDQGISRSHLGVCFMKIV